MLGRDLWDLERAQADLRSLAADKGYDDMSFREALRAVCVRPLIKHRVFAPYDHAHNARIDDERYHQRSTSESVNSSIKRSHDSSDLRNAWMVGKCAWVCGAKIERRQRVCGVIR